MNPRILQLASSFTSMPIGRTLRPLIINEGIADELGFAQYSQMTEYMLGPAVDDESIIGTIILLRVEDWLRESDKFSGSTSEIGDKARQELGMRVNEFAKHVGQLARRGKPVWFLACPSNGWMSAKYKLEILCKTYTNLVAARIEKDPGVAVLKWPASLLQGDVNDHSADRLGHIPFTPDAFQELGEFLGQAVTRTLSRKGMASQPTANSSSRTSELAAYLAGLRVHVRLKPAKSEDRADVDRLLRTVGAFSLMGEKRDIPDAEVDPYLNPERCMLISVSDRLSDHGACGLIAFRTKGDSLVVDGMALSCPVLGKQVEFALLAALAQIAANRKAAKMVFEYQPSGRNQLTLAFLQSVATAESDTRYVLPVELVPERTKNAAVAPGTWTLEMPDTLPLGNAE
jgi:hypothetical protein